MANKNKAKGTAAETRVVKFINGYEGLSAERLALHGSKDEGDIRVRIDKVTSEFASGEWRIEVKSGKQTQNPTRSDLTEWLKQTVNERINSGYPCALVVARHGKNPRDYDVYIPHGQNEWNEFSYLDVFCEELLG